MKNNQWQLRTTADTTRRAFTLVELLVVGAIIVILVGLTLFGMSKVTTHTKITKTRATIQKIDVAMQQIFVAYEREFALIKTKVATEYPEPAFSEETRQQIAAHFIRDLMRMEMPQSWAEVRNTVTGNLHGPLQMNITGVSDPDYAERKSPLLDYYYAAYPVTSVDPSRAALLFLIIQNLNPEALESFHGSEIAQNNDGLLEFVDAWGNPIQFLRWAPAFPGSDLQQDVVRMAGGLPNSSPGVGSAERHDNEEWWRARIAPHVPREQRLQDAMVRASVQHADPLDERINTAEGIVGWFLYPLIYSAGPDGKYGLAAETIDGISGEPVSPAVSPGGILNPFILPYGMPYDSHHFDNIHNHRWNRSF